MMKRAPSHLTIVAAGLAMGLGACTGGIAEDPADPGDGAGAGGGGDEPVVAFACQANARVELGRTPMRRLSHTEYDFVIEDALGLADRLGRGFTVDPSNTAYDNGADLLAIQPVLAEQYFAAAETLAGKANLTALVPCTGEDAACARTMAETLGLRLYRRPPDAAEVAVIAKVYDDARAAGDDHDAAMRLGLRLMLQSPQFLFRAELGTGELVDGAEKLDAYDVASRLSFLLWASLPDQALFDTAAAGRLATRDQVLAQAQRMLADGKAARRGIANFTNQWVGQTAALESGLNKDRAVFPEWTDATAGLMAQELRAFLDHVTWSDGGRLETFFTAPYTFMNQTLAAFYKTSGVTGAGFVKVDRDPARYGAGFLAQGGVMAALGKPTATHPVRRGLYVRQDFLCQDVPDPPEDIDRGKFAQREDFATAREFLAQHSQSASCAGCHALFDPLGLGLENFDGTGRYRDAEAGKPIDASGLIVEATDPAVNGPFSGAVELAARLAGSAQVRTCFVRHLFRYSMGRPETQADACTLRHMDDAGQASGYDLRRILLGVVESPAFLYRKGDPS